MKIISKIICIVFSLFVISAFAAQDWQSDKAAIQSAIDAGKYHDAKAIVDNYLSAIGTPEIFFYGATVYELLGQYKKAEDLIKQSSQGYKLSVGAESSDYARSLDRLAVIYRKDGQYHIALPIAKKAFQIQQAKSGQDHIDTAISARTLASLLQYVGDYQQANQYFQQALSVLVANNQGSPLQRLITLNNYSIFLYVVGQYQQGIDTLNKALQIIKNEMPKSHPESAETLNNKAAMMAALGDLQAAEKIYKIAASIRETQLGPQHPDLGTTLNNLAVLKQQQGHLLEAEGFLRQALAIREQQLGKQHAFTGTTLDNLSGILRTQGKFAEAADLIRRALKITEDALGPEHPDVANSLDTLGHVMTELGEIARAEQIYRRAIEIRKKSLGEDHPDIATGLQNLGNVLQKTGKYEEAEQVYRDALVIWEAKFGDEHPSVATGWNNLGALMVVQKKYDEAITMLEYALSIQEKKLGPEHPDVEATLNNLARIHVDQLKYDEAFPLLERALAISRLHAAPVQQLQLAANLAIALQDAGKYDQSLKAYNDAIQILEQLYANTRSLDKETRDLFIGKYAYIYRSFIQLLLNLHSSKPSDGYDLTLLEVVSRNQSRIFTEMMIQSNVDHTLGSVEFQGLLAREDSAYKQWHDLRLAKARLAVDSPDFDRNKTTLDQKISAAEKMYQTITSEIAQRYPQYIDLRSPRPMTVEELQGMLEENDVALSYSLLEKSLVVFLVTKTSFRLQEIQVERKVIANLVRHIHRATSAERGTEGLSALNPKQLYTLYSHLLAPVTDVITKEQRIYLFADGPLYTLPFEVLVRRYSEEDRAQFNQSREQANSEGGILFQEYAGLEYVPYQFVYLPSFAALRTLQKNKEQQQTQTETTLTAFADPLFPDFNDSKQVALLRGSTVRYLKILSRSVSGEDEVLTLPRLANTANEAKNIAKILGGKNALYLGEQAKESTVKSIDLKDAKYILFATHGLLGGDFNIPGAQPSLALSMMDKNENEDGFLTMSEVMDLELNADLVALSACNTAGESEAAQNGEGFAGLTRAFMYSGARNLMVSHWAVETHASQDMMEATFSSLKAGSSIGGSVNSARSKLKNSVLNLGEAQVSGAHPFFWGPYVVVGTGQ